MADEIKDENAEELEDLGAEGAGEGAEPEAEAESEAGAVAETGGAEEEEDSDVYEKSAAEILAEQAMLAELEASANEDDSDEDTESDNNVGVSVESPKNLELLLDVTLNITVELGRKEMRFGDVLNLGKGSLVELNKIADEPVDIYVNQSKIAEGEVVVVDDHFGVRITKLVNNEKVKSFA